MMRISPFILFCLFAVHLYADTTKDSRTDARKFDYFYLESLRLKQNNEPTNAYNLLQYALKIDSTSSAALHEISQYYLLLKKDSLALDALQKAVKYSPDKYEYKIALADLYRETQKFNESITIYEELAKKYPAKPEIHFYLSNLYIRVNQMDKAIESLDNLENNMGVSEAVSMQKYQIYNYIDKNAEAVKEIEKLSAKFPTEARYPIIIGDMYLEQGDTIQTLKYYEQARKLDSNNPYYFLAMARYHEYLGNKEAVVHEIDKALRNNQLEIETKLDILGKYIQNLRQTQKDVDSANALLETLLEQHSQEKELNMIYGKFLLSQNKVEEAKFQFQIVTEGKPDIISAWRELLNIALKEGNRNEVIVLCDNALIHFPDAVEFYYYKGMSYALEKEYKTALEVFKKALDFIPENNRTALSSFYGQIGDMYHYLNEKEKAYQAYDNALEYDDSNVLVLNNYAYFLSLDGENLDKAERMSAKCVQAQPNNATYIDTYAWIFFQKGNYSLAKFYIESALSKSRDLSGDITEHYGDILFMTGNVDKAVNEWKKALELKETEGIDTKTLKKKVQNETYYDGKE
ncbi:MAG: tetratricopeptide repeat protein [Dysgonamonadaceae bacterium]|jgi:tetratricopeptide (TPR) repeat protein|nr:tetratricopeptide repeat protein [Dysgonamonadaceae bacterium]